MSPFDTTMTCSSGGCDLEATQVPALWIEGSRGLQIQELEIPVCALEDHMAEVQRAVRKAMKPIKRRGLVYELSWKPIDLEEME